MTQYLRAVFRDKFRNVLNLSQAYLKGDLPGISANVLAQRLVELEKRGLVTREPHPTDRRTTLAVLTREGRALLKKATKGAAAAGFGAAGLATAAAGFAGAGLTAFAGLARALTLTVFTQSSPGNSSEGERVL